MRSVVSGTLVILLAFILVQSPGVSGLGQPSHNARTFILDTVHKVWTNICKRIVSELRYFLEPPSDSSSSRSYMKNSFMTDFQIFTKDLSNQLDILLESFAGRYFGIIERIINYIKDMVDYWNKLFETVTDKLLRFQYPDYFTKVTSALADFFMRPTQVLHEFLALPPHNRSLALNNFFDAFAHVEQQLLPNAKSLFTTLMNAQVDLINSIPEDPLGLIPIDAPEVRSFGSIFREETKNMFRNTIFFSGTPYTMYGTVHHYLIQKLADSNLGLYKLAIALLSHFLRSSDGLFFAYRELINECQSEDKKIDINIIEGENFKAEDMVYLRFFIDLSNTNRKEACEFYKPETEPGVPVTNADMNKFVLGLSEFLLDSVYDRETDLYNNLIMIDFVVQTVMGNRTEKCFLHFACSVGFMAARDKKDHGVTLLLALLLDGQTRFKGFYDMELVKKIGTPTIAKAMYQGYKTGHCKEYPGDSVHCLRLDEGIAYLKSI